MNIIKKILRFLAAVRNRLVKLERDKVKAYEETNKILSAYIAVLAERHGTVRIPKKAISEALGNFKASVGVDGEDYIITIERITPADILLPDISCGEVDGVADGDEDSGVEEEAAVSEPSDGEDSDAIDPSDDNVTEIADCDADGVSADG